MPRRRSRLTYYRRRVTVLLVPLLLVTGGIVTLRERGQRASADAGSASSAAAGSTSTTPPTSVHAQDDAAPIELPPAPATTPTTRPIPSTLEPDPVVPGGASKIVVAPASTVAAEHLVAAVPVSVPVLGRGDVPAGGVSAV